MDEAELLNGLFSGSRKYQLEFLRNYTPMIYAIARKINTRDPSQEFDDLVNDAFLHLFEDDFRRLKNFQFKSRLSTFIFTVVRRCLLTRTRKQDREDRSMETPDHANNTACTGIEWDAFLGPDPELEYLRAEAFEHRQAVFEKAAAVLDPEEQLQLRYHMDGYDTEQIMEIMDFEDRAKLDKRKFNILQKLKKEIRRNSIGARHGQ